MHCVDTGELQAIRFEHVNVQDIDKLNSILGMFKSLFHGNGRITLICNGGNIEAFETVTKTPNKPSRKPA